MMAINLIAKMLFVVISFLLVTSVSAAPPGTHFSKSAVPEGYTISPLRITGTIDGLPVNHTGTIQQVYAQLAAENSAFKFPTASTDPHASTSSSLKPRYRTHTDCLPISAWPNWYPARNKRIYEGIDHLNSVSAQCVVGVHSCSRVSCSWSSAIYVCNDADRDLITSCKYIASFAQDIIDSCSFIYVADPFGKGWYSGGQSWDSINFNVIVHTDNC